MTTHCYFLLNILSLIFFYQSVRNTGIFIFLTTGLGKDHEVLRRRIENGAKELWFFVQSELKKLKNLEGNELQRHADEFLSDLGHHERYCSPYTVNLDLSNDYSFKNEKLNLSLISLLNDK